MGSTPLLSVVIPAHNADRTIGRALSSVVSAREAGTLAGQFEIIVVDDGSDQAEALRSAISPFGDCVELCIHERNAGMCAARNTGIDASRGRFVMILDADDRLVANWGRVFEALLDEWPEEIQVAFAACHNGQGQPTVEHPDYSGQMGVDDYITERFAGEYLPIFRGDYVRLRKYVDLGTRKSCGTLSYLSFLCDGPVWVSARVLRIYDDRSPESVTAGWASRKGAKESVICINETIARFRGLYERIAPNMLGRQFLRLAVYLRLAGEPGAWSAWRRGLHWKTVIEAMGALLILLLGRRFCVAAIALAKRFRLIKRYG